MKKIALLMILSVCAGLAYAQRPVITDYNEDGLKYTSYEFYFDDLGSVILYEGDVSFLLLNSKKDFFVCKPCTVLGIGKKGTYADIELYDHKDNVKERLRLWLWRSCCLDEALETRSNKSTVQRIIKHLKQKVGPVRIYVREHYPKDWDVYLGSEK